MHVLLLSPAYPPVPGGGERYVRSLAHHLVRDGIDVTVVTSQADRESDFWQGTHSRTILGSVDGAVQLLRCPIRPFPGGRRGLLAWRKGMVMLAMLPGNRHKLLMRMARLVPPLPELHSLLQDLKGPIDLVHGFNLSWEHTAIAGWAYARQQGLPYVLTPFAHFGSGGRNRVGWNNMMDHQRHLLADADAVLTLTSVGLVQMLHWNVTLRRGEVLGGGLDALPPPIDPQQLLQQQQLTQPYALFVGRANADKGALHAAQATLALGPGGPQLVLAGTITPGFQAYYDKLTASDQEKIRPLGHVTEAEKHALLAACEMLLLPSRSDSFGIVLLEAWAHRKPVIGAAAGGIPRVIDDGVNGLLIPYGEVPALTTAMHSLLTDPARSRTMGQRGWEKVQQQYNWQTVSARLRQVYDSLTR